MPYPAHALEPLNLKQHRIDIDRILCGSKLILFSSETWERSDTHTSPHICLQQGKRDRVHCALSH